MVVSHQSLRNVFIPSPRDMLLGSLMQQLFPERGKVSSEALREGATSISPRAVTERDRRTAEKRNGRGGGRREEEGGGREG